MELHPGSLHVVASALSVQGPTRSARSPGRLFTAFARVRRAAAKRRLWPTASRASRPAVGVGPERSGGTAGKRPEAQIRIGGNQKIRLELLAMRGEL